MKHLELFEFFVEGQNQADSHVLLHITEPSTPQEVKKGYFFALVEVENGTLDQIELMQEIIDDLEAGYYETEDEKDGKDAFELTLEYINRKSSDVLDPESEVHCIVGVLSDSQLSFAYHGTPHGLLFFKKKEGLERIDILEEQEEDEEQLFPSVLQGELNSGDLFVVATPHVTDYFSYDRIQKILSSRKPKQSAAHIQKVLRDIKDDLSFGGIVMRVVPQDEIPRTGKKPKSRQGSAESLNKLLEAERITAETLSPPIFGNLTKKMTRGKKERTKRTQTKKDRLPETNYRPRRSDGAETIGNTILIHLGRAVVYGAGWLLSILKTVTIGIGRFIVIVVIVITNKNNGRRQVLDSLRRKWGDVKNSVEEMPLISKLLFTATLVLAIVFIGSITVIRVKENVAAEKQQYTNTFQAVIDKKTAADATLIYGDTEKALTLLREAEQMLTDLEKQKPNDADNHAEIRAGIDKTIQELRKLDVINLNIFADLTQEAVGTNLTSLAMIDNTLIAYGENTTNHFLINTNTGSVEKKSHDSGIHLQKNTTPKEQNKILFIHGKNSIAEFNKKNGAITSKDISYPSDDPIISNIFIYNVRLYTLDPKNNQIYKHSKTQTGYDKGASWINDDDIDLSDAVSLAIDGDIFVLKQNGEILKFEKGKKKPFSVSGLEPMLDNPTQLWTYSEDDPIFILEPTHKRVVLLDKNGKLIRQYTALEWQGPTSMIVGSENKILYILDSNKIYILEI